MSDKKSLVIRVALLGESLVGKSSILNALNGAKFDGKYNKTSSFNFIKKDFEFKKHNRIITYIISDCPGDQALRSVVTQSINESDVFILVYDITNKQSFQEFNDFWIEGIKTYRTMNKSK